MIIEPKIRGFICTTAHPKGCEEAVRQQIEYVKKHPRFEGPKNVLIIGASTGYGLATRIAATFGAGAKTIGVFYEKPAEDKRTASAGWYNTAAFEKIAHQDGHYAKSINGDAFSNEIKKSTIDLIKKDLGKIDLVVYSLASPRRIHPDSGEIFNSALKPIGKTYVNKTVDPMRNTVKEVTIEPANQDEINSTVAVMGGEDWEMWIDLLEKENLLAEGATTLAYNYIGPEMTHIIYKEGTIGRAKDHLQSTANNLNAKLKKQGGQAFISVNKALVTQASAALPVVPLYISILYKIMKAHHNHEGCIEQMYRMLASKIYVKNGPIFDETGSVRMDDWEMESNIQQEVMEIWPTVSTENLSEQTDIQGYQDDFYRLFGFRFKEVDYSADINPEVKIDSISAQETV
jgi:enoyl-[acyl-carrier protein] reductase/trans-2-enoyl-CoA reductase (NAD+)